VACREDVTLLCIHDHTGACSVDLLLQLPWNVEELAKERIMIERIVLADFALYRDVHHRWSDLFHKRRQAWHSTGAEVGDLGEGGPDPEQPNEPYEQPGTAKDRRDEISFSFSDKRL
jgi:hypothetical protein